MNGDKNKSGFKWFSYLRSVPATVALLAAAFASQGAQANERLDCLDDVLSLGLQTRQNLTLTASPELAEQYRRGLTIRVWVAYWYYQAFDYDNAQLAIASYSDLLSQLQSNGVVDPDAPGELDLSNLLANADFCVNNPPPPLATGLQTMESGAEEREFYLVLPADYGQGEPKPIVFAYHGYTGSYLNWVGDGRYYDLLDVIGDEAIFVAPQALDDANGDANWGGQDDLNFFLDMLAELELNGLVYDPNRVFVAGHSNGAGFTHDLGCNFGDVIRGIATAAGALTSNDCIGSMAVILIQGSNDPLTAGALAESTRSYWALYNGWDETVFGPATVGPCDDYSITDPPKPGNLPYPVLWCEHLQGHAWPDYGSQTVWDFFSGLPEAAPTTAYPPGGGDEAASVPSTADFIFQVSVPDGINQPLRGVFTLRELSYLTNPTCSAPTVIMSDIIALDSIMTPGELTAQLVVPVSITLGGGAVSYPSDWALSFSVYVEGGGTGVIPVPFVDQEFKLPLTLIDPNLDIIIPGVQTLTPIPDLCGF